MNATEKNIVDWAKGRLGVILSQVDRSNGELISLTISSAQIDALETTLRELSLIKQDVCQKE